MKGTTKSASRALAGAARTGGDHRPSVRSNRARLESLILVAAEIAPQLRARIDSEPSRLARKAMTRVLGRLEAALLAHEVIEARTATRAS